MTISSSLSSDGLSALSTFSPQQHRSFYLGEMQPIDQVQRIVSVAFSSEAPVARAFGIEMLDHSAGAIRLERLQQAAPLLLEHDTAQQIGVVERVVLGDDRIARAIIRFSTTAKASEIFQDICDGIRQHVSVGYVIHQAEQMASRDGTSCWKITDWEPFELSIVAVPADYSVGIGRALTIPDSAHSDLLPSMTRITPMTSIDAAPTTTDNDASLESERSRVAAILEMGQQYGAVDVARRFIADGQSVISFQRALLDHIHRPVKHASTLTAGVPCFSTDSAIGLSDGEIRQFSLMKVIRALSDPTDKRAQESAAFEFDASRAAAEKRGHSTDKFVIPSDVLTRALSTIPGPSAGSGTTVATQLLSHSFVEMLHNHATLLKLGSSMGGLVGNIDIPKQVAAAQGYWIGEDDDAPESQLEFGQISLTPKTVAAFTDITRRLMVQSSLDVEALVRADLAKALALTIDKAGYYGSGSEHQPLGILQHTGIHRVNFAQAQPTYAELVAMESAIASDNVAVSSMAYVGNATFRGHAKTNVKFAQQGGSIWEEGDTINGYAVEITNQLNVGDVVMGNFADILIGLWGGLELLVDPYANSKKGRLRIVVFQDVDFALRRAQSFCMGRKAASTKSAA